MASPGAGPDVEVRPVRLLIPGRPDDVVHLPFTRKELDIIEVLRGTLAAFNLKTTVRIAGGWVRDKLAARSSHDIDVALDDTTGREFATKVTEFLAARGDPVSSIGVVEANPEQSKHLETAITRVLDCWIDFVNLRTEVYDPGSRIPTVRFGTPLEDAQRRDFTVNALFYNVNEDAIEDFTGQGIADFKACVLRTPLDPLITFNDDPLRVLRAVRFAARFGFTMVPPLRAAAQDAGIHAALSSKISRERVGNELEGMLQGPAPSASLRLLHGLGLLGPVLRMQEGTTFHGSLALPPGLAIPPPLPGAYAAAGVPPAAGPSTFGPASPPPVLDGAPGVPTPLWHDVALHVVSSLNYLLGLLPNPGVWGHPDPAAAIAAALAAPPAPPAPAPALAPCLRPASAAPPRGLVPDLGTGFLIPADRPLPPTGYPPEALADNAACAVGALSPDAQRLLYYAATLFPLTPLQYAGKKKGKLESVVFSVLSIDGLRRKHKEADDVGRVLEGAGLFLRLAPALAPGGGAAPDAAAVHEARLEAGLALRLTVRELWPAAMHIAAAASLVRVLHHPSFRVEPAPSALEAGGHAIAAVLAPLAALSRAITGEWRQDGSWERRLALDGKEVIAVVGAKGAEVKPFMTELTRWQVLHPEGTPEQAREHLRAFAAAFAAGEAGGSA